MLDERKIKLIELIIEGTLNKTEIAKQLGISRNCMYDWMRSEEWIAAYDKRLQEIKTNANKLFNAKLDSVIDEWYRMMMDDSCEKRTRAKLMVDWVDRSLGKATAKLEISDNKEDQEPVNVLDEIDDYESELEEDN